MLLHHKHRRIASTTLGSGGTYEYGWSSTDTNSTGGHAPFNVYWRRRIIQQIILASDLTAAGVPSGATFSNFTWNQSQAVPSLNSILGFNFKLFHTTQSDGQAVASPISGQSKTTCYQDSTTTEFTLAETTGDKTLTFANTFTWNGTNNICIETCNTQCQSAYTGAGQMRILLNQTNGMRLHRSDDPGSACGETPDLTQNYKYAFKMDYS